MPSQDQRLLKESLDLVAPVADQLIAAFYHRLFTEQPQVRSMFPAAMETQRERLLNAIIAVVTHYDHPENLLPALTAMGKRHQVVSPQFGDRGVQAVGVAVPRVAGDQDVPAELEEPAADRIELLWAVGEAVQQDQRSLHPAPVGVEPRIA